MDKYLIVGLGNPGYEYENTRHNTGFMVLDKMAESVGVSFEDKRYGYVAETSIKGRKVFLLKPTTYMNLSGNAVRYWLQKENRPETTPRRRGRPLHSPRRLSSEGQRIERRP